MRYFFFVLACSISISACIGTNKVADYNKVTGNKPSPVHGEEVLMRYGALEGVGETNANGVGFARKYEDGVWVVTVNLNIAIAPQGKEYTAYLRDSGGERFEIGQLRSLVGDARHSASADIAKNMDDADMVEVFLEDLLVANGTLRSPST